MNPNVYQEIAVRFMAMAAHLLWQGLLIASAAGILARVFGRKCPQRAYALYMGSLILLVLCVPLNLLTLGNSSNRIPTAAQEPSPRPFEIAELDTAPDSNAPTVALEETSSASSLDSSEPGALADKWDWRPIAPWILNLYWAGFAFMILRMSAGIQGGHRLRRFSQTTNDPLLLAPLRELARRLRLKKPPALASDLKIKGFF